MYANPPSPVVCSQRGSAATERVGSPGGWGPARSAPLTECGVGRGTRKIVTEPRACPNLSRAAWPQHQLRPDPGIELFGRDPPKPHGSLSQRGAFLMGLLGDSGRPIVANVGAQRGNQHQ